MARLELDAARLADPDGFYEMLQEALADLDDAASMAFNARLVLILANEVGNADLLSQAVATAREGL